MKKLIENEVATVAFEFGINFHKRNSLLPVIDLTALRPEDKHNGCLFSSYLFLLY